MAKSIPKSAKIQYFAFLLVCPLMVLSSTWWSSLISNDSESNSKNASLERFEKTHFAVNNSNAVLFQPLQCFFIQFNARLSVNQTIKACCFILSSHNPSSSKVYNLSSSIPLYLAFSLKSSQTIKNVSVGCASSG